MNDVFGGFPGKFVEIERCIPVSTDRVSSLMRIDTKSHRKSGTSSFTFIGKRCKESLLNLFPKVRQSKAGLNGSKLGQCSVTKH